MPCVPAGPLLRRWGCLFFFFFFGDVFPRIFSSFDNTLYPHSPQNHVYIFFVLAFQSEIFRLLPPPILLPLSLPTPCGRPYTCLSIRPAIVLSFHALKENCAFCYGTTKPTFRRGRCPYGPFLLSRRAAPVFPVPRAFYLAVSRLSIFKHGHFLNSSLTIYHFSSWDAWLLHAFPSPLCHFMA